MLPSHVVKIGRALAVIGACALTTLGCGGPAAGRVNGQVVRKGGVPLADANLIARNNETGKSCYATTEADGQYEFSSGEAGAGVPPGTYSVVVLEKQAGRDAIRQPTIAARYGDPAQSGLSFTVAAGEKKTFDVTVDPP